MAGSADESGGEDVEGWDTDWDSDEGVGGVLRLTPLSGVLGAPSSCDPVSKGGLVSEVMTGTSGADEGDDEDGGGCGWEASMTAAAIDWTASAEFSGAGKGD
jgi:hypothetical protein